MASIGINTDLDFSAPTSSTPAVGASKILKVVTASRAVVSNASGDLAASAVTATELGYVSGVTSAIQTQLNALAATLPVADTQTIIKGSADATKLLRFEVDGFTTATTRVLTPPNAHIVIAGSASALTSGRIPYVTTGGLLTDSANATLDGSGNAAFANLSTLNAPDGLAFNMKNAAGTLRWIWRGTGAESGSNAGYNLELLARDDAGSGLFSPLTMIRSTGAVAVGNSSLSSAQLNVTSLSASRVACAVRGAASQSANLTEWQNSSGTVQAFFELSAGGASGRSRLGVTSVGTNEAAYFDINGNGTGGSFWRQTTGTGAMAFQTLGSSVQFYPGNILTYTLSTTALTFVEGINLIVGTTTGTKIGTSTSQKLGFWNATPVVRPSAYTPTNVTTDRAFDANSTTLDEVADVLGTLIADLQSIGLIG